MRPIIPYTQKRPTALSMSSLLEMVKSKIFMVYCFLVCLKKTPGASQLREQVQSIIMKNTQLPTLWHGGCRGLEPPGCWIN